MPSLHPRCVQHGLAVAPDGRCVLCRRQNPGDERASYKPPLSAAPTARESRRVRLWGGGALLVLIAAGTGLALRYTGSEPLTVQPTAAGARLTEPVYDPDAEQARTRALALHPRGSVPTIAIDKELLSASVPAPWKNASPAPPTPANAETLSTRSRAAHSRRVARRRTGPWSREPGALPRAACQTVTLTR